MKRLKNLWLIPLFLFSLPLFGQTPVQSPSDLDRESAALAALIRQYPGTGSLEVGAFSSSGLESPLGNFWRQNLLNQLAGSGFTILAPGGTARGDMLLSGEILDMGQTVRIFTRLVNRANSAVLASWTTDLGKTPFLMGLLFTESSGSSSVPRDAYEEDSWENPVPVEINGPALTRTIHRDDRDWFVIKSDTTVLAIMETSGSMDTVMELYDERRTRLAQDDDSGERDNARIQFQLEGGKSYIAMVKGYGSSDTGRYEFFVKTMELPDRAMEPNDTRETAFRIETGRDTEAYLTPDDRDWYIFTVNSPGTFAIYTQGRVDTMLYLHDSSGRELARDDDSGSSANARIIRHLEAGTYYVMVKGNGRSDTGPYTLSTRVRENAGGDSYESDDTPETAREIKVGETQRRTFTSGDDMDWVFFTIDAAAMYRIRAQGENSTGLDTFLELYDSGIKKITEDDDGGQGYSSLIRRYLEPGRYYIKVSCLDDDPEEGYLLTLERN